MYNKLSKEEKKIIKNKYAATKKGKDLTDNLNRLFIEGLLSIGSSIVIVVFIFIYKLAWWYWFFAGLTLLCGVIFLIGQYSIRMKEYNKFLVHDNKKRKK